MITEAVIALFGTMISFVLALLPDWSPLEISDPIESVASSVGVAFDLLAWLDFYAPVHEAMGLVLVSSGLYVGILMYRMIVWVASWIRGGGGTE